MKIPLAIVLSCCLRGATLGTLGGQDVDNSELEMGFVHPPDSARPWVYWFWMDGNVTRAGITADLEAMRRVGIGGVLLMDVTQGLPAGPVQFGSSEWHELFKYAVAEAGRLGLDVTMSNSAGWTGSGGPWITPALAMQKLVSAKTNLVGPLHFSGLLPQFFGPNPNCRPIATLAFPSLGGEGGALPGFPPERVTINGKDVSDSAKLFDDNPNTHLSVPAPTARQPQSLQLEFAKPFTATSLRLVGSGRPQSFHGTLQVSNDGRDFRNVREFINGGSLLALAFEQTSARFFRLLFTDADAGLTHLEFAELELAPTYRIPWYESKTGAGPMPLVTNLAPLLHVPSEAVIPSDSVLDLTPQISATGLLNWDVPKGHWTVLGLACAPIGTENHPAPAGGGGLECDKLSQEAVSAHFAGFLGRLVAENGPGSAFKAAHIDSWEVGFQNFTPRFCAEFQNRRGYNPLPYLPTFTGRFVAGPDQSERFLWDVRRTIADLLADNYAGHLAELAHEHGLKLSIEAYASLGKGPFDDLLYAGRADVPMTEFWYGQTDLSKLDLRPMPSAAHTYGRSITAAEAFTSYPSFAKWDEHPFALKPLADAAFCEGVNRLVFHRYAHQPWRDRAPGMTMGPLGLHYERTQTWWEQSRAWHEYLARCQYLLQRGVFVAELCYLTDEGAFCQPPARDQLNPAVPPGYNYDLVTPEVVLTRLSVKDGDLLLPDGMSYHALILPTARRMTPGLLRRIKELVEAGATVVGPSPTNSPSLARYPHCDVEVDQLGRELWGACDGKTVLENHLGKGTVSWGKPVADVLVARSAAPDFLPGDTTPGWPLRSIHRRIGDAEVYFVANANARPVKSDCQFRVSGKRPEFWHPDTGEREQPAAWRQEGGFTAVPLRLDAGGSVFVVFRHSSTGTDPVAAITRNGQADDSASLTFDRQGRLQLLARQPGDYSLRLASGKQFEVSIKDLPVNYPIPGKWDLYFPPGSGAPNHVTLDQLISWTAHPNPDVRYFSGTATYKKSFSISPGLLSSNRQIYLSLGRVQVIAEVKLNGQDCGILWKPPFEAEITQAIRDGDNTLEIKVVNVWLNRLIGDEHLLEDCKWQTSLQTDSGVPIAEWPRWLLEDKPSPTGRTTFAAWKYWIKDSPLIESGLLGPITLRVTEQQTLP